MPLVKKAVADGLMAQGDEKGFVTVNDHMWIVEKKKAASPLGPIVAAGAGKGL